MRALVTGANGFLGSHLVDLLLETGDWELRTLVRRTSDLRWLQGKPIELVYGDVTQAPSALSPALSDVEVVFHIAGLTKAVKKKAFYVVNEQGTENLFQACFLQEKPPSRFVLVSSAGAQGPSQADAPLLEDDEPNPVTEYGRSKLAGERIAAKYMNRMSIVIVRPGGIYGPRDTEFLPIFDGVNRGLLTRLGFSPGVINVAHVKDVAKAIRLAGTVAAAKSETFLIGGVNINQVDLGRTIGRVLGKKFLFPLVIPKVLFRFAALLSSGVGKLTSKPRIFTYENTSRILAKNWSLNMSKAQNILGYQPEFDLESGLKDTLNWYRSENLL
ncbi:MAG: NAD-dependent epimerase/dehydratase family protein [Deltaproteobacteria bacterium]|nr:NAD-dependent epimerase/dehydratase family protein [Deltaproteobacteria bacterium]